MTEHKFTDEEVIKALELCFAPIGTTKSCAKCPYRRIRLCKIERDRAALDLINRQKAEIEEQHQAIINALKRMGEIRAEAIKEVAEELKSEFVAMQRVSDGKVVFGVSVERIESIVKERLEGG